jgi:hypothetical protein
MTELAEGGKDYLYDLSSAISGSEPNQTVAQNFDLEEFDDGKYWSGSNVCLVPDHHEDYGMIYEGSERNLIYKGPRVSETAIAVAHPDTVHYDENVVETRVYLEAESRNDEELFAEPVAWDGKNFNWILMEQIPGTDSEEEAVSSELKPRGWIPEDLETRSSKVIDYGLFEPEDEWRIPVSEAINDDRAYFPDNFLEGNYNLTEGVSEEENIERLIGEEHGYDLLVPPPEHNMNLEMSRDILDILDAEAADQGESSSKETALVTAKALEAMGTEATAVEGEIRGQQHYWTTANVNSRQFIVDNSLGIVGPENVIATAFNYNQHSSVPTAKNSKLDRIKNLFS